jgi:hypothetical protein
MLIKTYASLLAFQTMLLGTLASGPLLQLVQMLTCSAIALLLWIEFDGRHPAFVVGGVTALALVAGSPAGAVAAVATGALLFLMKGKPSCAESSAR